MKDSQKTSNLLGSALLGLGLVGVFLGQRVFASDTSQLVVTGLGLMCLLIATGMRAAWPTRVVAVLRFSMFTATRWRSLIFWKSDSLAR